MQNYRKYTWVGNRISEQDMTRLHGLKEIRKRPITLLVAEAVRQFLDKELSQENKARGTK